MAKTPSSMAPLGTKAPSFSLPDARSGKAVTFDGCAGAQGTLVAFICNHCPFVVHIISSLSDAIREFSNSGINTVLISANDIVNYPDDSPDKMKFFALEHNLSCPYLYDESQAVAKAYHAACTPDFFLFDTSKSLVYRGQYDDARPGNGVAVTGQDLKAAVKALAAGDPISPDQKPSIGCNIKWKA